MSEFKREDRYLVIKRSDIDNFWRDDVREQFMAALKRLNEHHVRTPQREYVVIENDWPEYEPVWQMIERRVSGQPSELDRVTAERDALQLRLNAADQRIDELTQRQGEPVSWGAPKTVHQLIRQLQTLDPELETHAMLRIPDFKDGKQVRSCPLSISYERMEGPWLSSFKGDGRKVIAFWAKPDPRDLQDQGETLTESAESR